MKEKISQVLVVEGWDDTSNLKRYFVVETDGTAGSAIFYVEIKRIKGLHGLHGVNVLNVPGVNW